MPGCWPVQGANGPAAGHGGDCADGPMMGPEGGARQVPGWPAARRPVRCHHLPPRAEPRPASSSARTTPGRLVSSGRPCAKAPQGWRWPTRRSGLRTPSPPGPRVRCRRQRHHHDMRHSHRSSKTRPPGRRAPPADSPSSGTSQTSSHHRAGYSGSPRPPTAQTCCWRSAGRRAPAPAMTLAH